MPPALSPGGRTVCVFTRTTAEVLSADDGVTPIHTFEMGRVGRATYSPDGRSLAHPNLDQSTVTVWDVTSGRVVGRPPPKSKRTLARTAFSRDGRFLALSIDSYLVVWEVATGAQVTPPLTVRYAQD